MSGHDRQLRMKVDRDFTGSAAIGFNSCQLEGLALVRAWGFESPLPHQRTKRARIYEAFSFKLPGSYRRFDPFRRLDGRGDDRCLTVPIRVCFPPVPREGLMLRIARWVVAASFVLGLAAPLMAQGTAAPPGPSGACSCCASLQPQSSRDSSQRLAQW